MLGEQDNGIFVFYKPQEPTQHSSDQPVSAPRGANTVVIAETGRIGGEITKMPEIADQLDRELLCRRQDANKDGAW